MIDLRPCSLDEVRSLVERFHGYQSMGSTATYAFAVYERDLAVAAFSWQPPPPGSAKSVCPEAPFAVLSLSRMVAVPKTDRNLKHISKPLMLQMKKFIDRTRWPVLVTYSDEGQGHTGYVYQCAGWSPTSRTTATTYEVDGRRISSYSCGRSSRPQNSIKGKTILQRWEHWACLRGSADRFLKMHGWQRVPIPGKVWASGSPAFKLIHI